MLLLQKDINLDPLCFNITVFSLLSTLLLPVPLLLPLPLPLSLSLSLLWVLFL